MTPAQALENLSVVARQFRGTADEHAILAKSIETLRELLPAEPEEKIAN